MRSVTCILAAALSLAASAASAADFYQGKQVTIVVGFSAAGTYDATARLFARHLGKHLAGKPTVIVRNMPGAEASLPPTASTVRCRRTAPRSASWAAASCWSRFEQSAGDLRRQALQLDRRPDARQFPLSGLAHGPGERAAGRDAARDGGRRDRSGFTDADLSEGAQRAVGDKVQDRVRLSRRQRDHARAGARRGRRLLRLGARQHQDPRAGLDPRRQDQAARAVHAGEIRRASERAAGDRSRKHR